MNADLNQIINNTWVSCPVNYNNFNSIKGSVPRSPGIYTISTDASIMMLRQIETRMDSKHYNFNNKIDKALTVTGNIIIHQVAEEQYIVYSGHAQCLRQRLVEHFEGADGTAGLAVFREAHLHDYQWTFSYLNLALIENYIDSKLFRTIIEQYHRAKIGWPILCGQ